MLFFTNFVVWWFFFGEFKIQGPKNLKTMPGINTADDNSKAGPLRVLKFILNIDCVCICIVLECLSISYLCYVHIFLV